MYYMNAICKRCQAPFTKKIHNQEFCTRKCTNAYWNHRGVVVPKTLDGAQYEIIEKLIIEFQAANLAKKLLDKGV